MPKAINTFEVSAIEFITVMEVPKEHEYKGARFYV